MKRGILSLLVFAFLISTISADLIITQEPNSQYNLGDMVRVPIKISSLSDVNDFLKTYLICNGIETEVHKEYVILSQGGEKTSEVIIPLILSFTGQNPGTCSIKAVLKDQTALSKEFSILNTIEIKVLEQSTSADPSETAFIKGEAKKGTGEGVSGFIELSLLKDDTEALRASDIISKGIFNLNFSIPYNFPAGDYLASLKSYEKDSEGGITNSGTFSTLLKINQAPRNLEVAFDESEVTPDSSAKITAILHDQTGEKISSTASIKIINEKGKIIDEKEISTGEIYELPIKYNQAHAEWKVEAISGELTGEGYFRIKEFPRIQTTLINKTLLIKNTGNVIYNDSIFVKIGENSVEVSVLLGVDEEKKYNLKAPDGEYEVEVLGQTQRVSLTGNAIGVKEISALSQLIGYPSVWMFVIGILGFMSYIFFKKGYNKTFIGYITRKKEGMISKTEVPLRKDSMLKSRNRAELSLSIKGAKQDVSLVCVKIKNLNEIEKTKGDVEHTLQQIVENAEEKKALTYENQDNLIFIISPALTKTFRNEKSAVQTAQTIQRILEHHNKLFKDKIDYGIAVNKGSIVGKPEEDSFKFMSMGTLLSDIKRIAGESKKEVLISEGIKDSMATEIKTEKVIDGKTPAYKIKEMKVESEENKKFLSSFIKRLEEHA